MGVGRGIQKRIVDPNVSKMGTHLQIHVLAAPRLGRFATIGGGVNARGEGLTCIWVGRSLGVASRQRIAIHCIIWDATASTVSYRILLLPLYHMLII